MASEGFFERVYEVVEQIPEGMVATYGQVALLAGRPRSARYVGYALHSNPRPGQIPCHRVVFADGRICEGFAFGGPDAQREFLMGEGVTFTDPMHVDLVACRWPAGSSGSAVAKTTTKVPVPFVVVFRCRFTGVNLWRRCVGVYSRQKVNHGELYWFQQRSRQ